MLQIMQPQVLVNWQCAINPDGRWALSGAYDGSVRLWELASGQQIRLFSGHTDWVISLVFAPDGKKALTGSKDGSLIYWDLESGELVRESGYTGQAVVFDIALSPDGRTAISGSIDQVITQCVIAHPSLEELLDWIAANRYVRELSCEEKARYQIEPLCP